jgi:hypothetical protein
MEPPIMADPDLSFIAEQLRRLIIKVDSLADDGRVTSAMLVRLDHRIERIDELLTDVQRELRAMVQQHARMADRIERLETGVS